MKYPVIIKRSPLALIKNIILIELLAGFLLFASAYLTNYEKFYRLVFGGLIRYDYFLVLAASIFQLVLTMAIFLRWHNENYELREKEIIRKRGILAVTQTFFPLKDVKSVSFRQDLFEKLTNCGTVAVDNFKLRHIENGEVLADTIKSLVERIGDKTQDSQKLSVLDLILNGENYHLEFKQSLRWDLRQDIVNKDLEKAAMRTIASFLNVEGGSLLLGVADNKTVAGLEQDYQSLPRQDRDGFENHFNHIFNSMLGPRFRPFVKLNFEKINNRDVCLVQIGPSDSPVYLKANSAEEFFIRTGNAVAALAMSEAQDYIKSRWG